MRTHFISRLALLLVAGFLIVATQVWSGNTLQWIFVGGGVIAIALAALDAAVRSVEQRALDGLIVLVGLGTIVEALLFDGANNLKWWSFACACGLAVLATIGLMLHEARSERVVHELSVTETAYPGTRVPTA